MKNAKNRIFFLFYIFIQLAATVNLSADPFFSGYAGIRSVAAADSSSLSPTASLNEYFAGQIDFSGIFLLRTEFSVATNNILKQNIFKSTDAVFNFDEISLTIRHQVGGHSIYTSLFMGTYEPIGSDIFLQRQFGIEPISSIVTDNWLGLNGSVVYPFYGFGGAVVLHPNSSPWAIGTYMYVNQNDYDGSDSSDPMYVLNDNIRFACVYDYFCADIAAGLGAPLGDEVGNEKVILVIDKLYANMGADLLIGNKYATSFFLQGGFSDMLITRGAAAMSVDADNTYLLTELRLATQGSEFDFSFFSFPQETADSLLFINDTLGVNAALYSKYIHIGDKQFTVGSHLTVSFPEKTYYDLIKPSVLLEKIPNLKISPFLAVQLGAGTLHTMIQVNITDLLSVPIEAVQIDVGYKTHL